MSDYEYDHDGHEELAENRDGLVLLFLGAVAAVLLCAAGAGLYFAANQLMGEDAPAEVAELETQPAQEAGETTDSDTATVAPTTAVADIETDPPEGSPTTLKPAELQPTDTAPETASVPKKVWPPKDAPPTVAATEPKEPPAGKPEVVATTKPEEPKVAATVPKPSPTNPPVTPPAVTPPTVTPPTVTPQPASRSFTNGIPAEFTRGKSR